jgi:integrase
MSRDAVHARITRYQQAAAESCPSLAGKNLTPHTLRHYVDGWVMWLAAASPLVAEPRVLVPAT